VIKRAKKCLTASFKEMGNWLIGNWKFEFLNFEFEVWSFFTLP
jgi:hypothetical protein